MLGQTLEAVDHQPYLGVTLSKSLNWKEHTMQVKKKANSSLGFIKRNFHSRPERVKKRRGAQTQVRIPTRSSKMGKIETFLSSDDQWR